MCYTKKRTAITVLNSKCIPSELKSDVYCVDTSAEILFVRIQPGIISTLKMEVVCVSEKHVLTNLRDYEMWTQCTTVLTF